MRHVVPITLAVLVLAAVPAVSASAQSRHFDLTASAAWVDTSSEGTFNEDDPIDVNFDGTLGYGLAANIFWGGRVSTEFAIVRVDSDVSFQDGATTNDSTAEMMPITGVLQFHFAPDAMIDPYIGAGAAYVLIDDVDRPNELPNLDFERLDFKDDVGLALNAGLGIRFSQSFGLTLDAKYVPLESSATAVTTTGDEEVRFDINPVILSAGISWRF